MHKTLGTIVVMAIVGCGSEGAASPPSATAPPSTVVAAPTAPPSTVLAVPPSTAVADPTPAPSPAATVVPAPPESVAAAPEEPTPTTHPEPMHGDATEAAEREVDQLLLEALDHEGATQAPSPLRERAGS